MQDLLDVQSLVTNLPSMPFPHRQSLDVMACSMRPDETPLRNLLPRVVIDEKAAPEARLQTKMLGVFVEPPDADAGADKPDVSHFLRQLMYNEEYSLIHGDAASAAIPWGDGTTCLAYDGLARLIENQSLPPHRGLRFFARKKDLALMLNAALSQVYERGGRDLFALMPGVTFNAISQNMGSVQIAQANSGAFAQQSATNGVVRAIYKHAMAGDVTWLPSRFLDCGSILFGALRCVDGHVLEVQVASQVGEKQGYVLTPLDGSGAMISIYETLALLHPQFVGKISFDSES